MVTELLQKRDTSRIRAGLFKIEEAMKKAPGTMQGDCFPLRHTFVDGAYVREISMPKGTLITSKIHKVMHPFFILKGDVTVFNSEKGYAFRIKAPYSGITPAGTKRILYIHEDTVWTTVHVTNETDLDKIEEQIVAKTYDEIKFKETYKIKNFEDLDKGGVLCLG